MILLLHVHAIEYYTCDKSNAVVAFELDCS